MDSQKTEVNVNTTNTQNSSGSPSTVSVNSPMSSEVTLIATNSPALATPSSVMQQQLHSAPLVKQLK